MLINVSLVRGQSLKVDKCGVLCASDLSTSDLQTDSDILSNKSPPAQIYFDSNRHKKIENMTDFFRFYKASAILNRALEFPVNFLLTETHIFTYILNVH